MVSLLNLPSLPCAFLLDTRDRQLVAMILDGNQTKAGGTEIEFSDLMDDHSTKLVDKVAAQVMDDQIPRRFSWVAREAAFGALQAASGALQAASGEVQAASGALKADCSVVRSGCIAPWNQSHLLVTFPDAPPQSQIDEPQIKESQSDDATDVAQQTRQPHEQLMQRSSRMKSVVSAMADGVAVASRDGCLEIFNRAAEEILGVGFAKIDSDQWSSVYGLYLPDGITRCPTDQLPLVRATQGEKVDDFHLIVRRPSSESMVDVNVKASPIYDSKGNLDGGVAVFRDVTQRLLNERLLNEARRELELRVQELKASEEKYQDLYESSPDMYVTVDATSATIIECNQTLIAATGYDKHQIVGRSFFSLHDPSCVDSVTEAFHSFRNSGEFPNGEYSVRCSDNRKIDVSLKMTGVRNENGRVILGRFVWRDITKQKQALEMLTQHRDELAHVTRLHTVGEMATGLAHELNQPLNAIVNYARGFSMRAVEGNPVTKQMHDAAKQIVREAERAASIIAGLRRLVAKQTPAHAASCLNQIVERAVLLCAGEAKRYGVSIERNLASDLPVAVVDAVQIKQVVLSLVLNAIENLAECDTQYPRVVLSSRLMENHQLEIEVEDNGTGMTAETQGQVFDPFFTTKPHGMGMGLAICRSIVENHAGNLSCRNRPQGGTSFCFSLPAKPGELK